MNKLFLNLFAKQLRKPNGLFGKFVAKKMQDGNKIVYEWVLPQIDFNKAESVIEIGYGTGLVINKIANDYNNINCFGIDFSKVMYDKAIKLNSGFINSGKMKLEYGDFLNYNSPVNVDIIFCINVIYFWNELNPYLNKIHSLLKPGGSAYIYMADPETLLKLKVGYTDTFNKHNLPDVISKLNESKFSHVEHKTESLHGMVGHCIKATK